MDMEGKYKVGTRIKVKPDLDLRGYSGIRFIAEMLGYRGRTGTIMACEEHYSSSDGYVYRIDIDDRCWMWTDPMLERAVDPLTPEEKTRILDISESLLGLIESEIYNN